LTDPRKGQIFISYSRRDEEVMRRVVSFLRKEKFNVWVDNEKLTPGTPTWKKAIEAAIKNAAAVVVLLSPDSCSSVWVKREISFAESHEVAIFPLLIAGNERNAIPITLVNHQRIDLRRDEKLGLRALGIALSFHLEQLRAHEQREKEAAKRERRAREEKEERERKAVEEKRKKEAAEKAAREEEEHKAREKARKEEEARERAAAKERARLVAAQKAKKEREERERKEAAEKARKEKEEREREATAEKEPEIRRGSPSPRKAAPKGAGRGDRGSPAQRDEGSEKPAWLPYGIGGVVVVILVCLIFCGTYLYQNVFAPDEPMSTKPSVATEAPDVEEPAPVEEPELSETQPPLVTENLDVGSTMISEKDGMVMVYVPAGEFEMGSDADDALAECQKFYDGCERDWFTDEEPIHTVDLDAFWIDRTEVTNAMYAKCVDTGDCNSPSSTSS
jgi:formylglycine-generating enzyme required for sulfatase activity